MNLEESNSFKEQIEKDSQKKRTIIMALIVCGILMLLLFGLIIYINYQDSITEKFYLDGKQLSKTEGLYREIQGSTYVDLKSLSSILGYTYTKGVYGEYNENEDSAYMQNNFEILAVSANDQKYDKYLELTQKATLAEIPVTLKSENGYSETFNIEKPIIFVDGKIYAPLDNIPEMFNIKLDWKEYRKRIYTLENLVLDAQKKVGKLGYNQISGYYENLRALLYGYAIVGNTVTNQVYGVVSLEDGKEIISLKYDDIKFVQNEREFYITTGEGMMGLLGEDGSTIIAPSEFEQISLLDKKEQLYLVKKDEEYGVLNRKGKVLIYAENDAIGYDTTPFTTELIDNHYLLFGKVIPAEKNNKFGLYNLEGELVLPITYDGLGYKSTASRTSGNEESTLIIPSSVGINGVVVNLNDLYGIFDVNEQSLILPCVYSKIYSITKSGKTTYYVEYKDEEIELKQLLKENNLDNIEEDKESNTSKEDDEYLDNENTNTTNTTNTTNVTLN